MVRAFAFDRHFDKPNDGLGLAAFASAPNKADAPFEPLFEARVRDAGDDKDRFGPPSFRRRRDGAAFPASDGFSDAPAPPPRGGDGDVLSEFGGSAAAAAAEALFDEADRDLVGVFEAEPDDLAQPHVQEFHATPDPAREQEIYDEAFAEGERQGYDRGRVDAEAAARNAHEVRVAEALEALAAAIPDARGQIDALLERVERRASRLAFAVVRKLAPALESGVARETTARLMAEALKAAGAAPFIVVEASADVADLIESRIDDLRALIGSRAEVEISVVEDVSPGHLRVLWETGGLEYDVAGASSAMTDLIARAEEAAAGSVWEAA